jgi:hypothetical protein
MGGCLSVGFREYYRAQLQLNYSTFMPNEELNKGEE